MENKKLVILPAAVVVMIGIKMKIIIIKSDTDKS